MTIHSLVGWASLSTSPARRVGSEPHSGRFSDRRVQPGLLGVRHGDDCDDATTNSTRLTCDHKAVFSLAYLRTTKEYQYVAGFPVFLRDVTWVNREDAIFAGYYFTALAQLDDRQHRGRAGGVADRLRLGGRQSRDRLR